LDSEVRRLIEAQHKAMLKQLRGGAFDVVICERLGLPSDGASSAPKPTAPEPSAPPAGVNPASADSASRPLGSSASPGGSDTAPSLEVELPAAEATSATKRAVPAFGDAVDAEKPLDEVILEYLVEKARSRSEERENRPARSSRSKE
jgi:hypothetical protein